jgi:tetratricopeptide (TPR) repeat protein
MRITYATTQMKSSLKLTAFCFSLLLFLSLPSLIRAQDRGPRLIRDTDIAEGKDESEAAAPKEPNPVLAVQNVNIGNYYLKQQNYAAAIQRFLEAIEYQVDLLQAYEGLAQAYEKNGQIPKAIDAFKGFLEKNPDSPKAKQFQSKLAKLEKKIK